MHDATTSPFARRLGVVLLVAVAMIGCTRDPRATALPMDVADLSPIQPQLDALGAEERELVLGYLARSHGDVLPARFADPAEPFTARTFAEAIVLQREFLVRQAGEDAAVADVRQQRENRMAPLRNALRVTLLRREMLSHAAVYGEPALDARGAKVARFAGPDTPMLVVTYLVQNASNLGITAASGSISLRDAAGARLVDCWLNESEPLTASASREIRCGSGNRLDAAGQRELAERSASDLTLLWEPASIRFADGSTLRAGN